MYLRDNLRKMLYMKKKLHEIVDCFSVKHTSHIIHQKNGTFKKIFTSEVKQGLYEQTYSKSLNKKELYGPTMTYYPT
jgi:hypothetical protein